MEGIMFGLVWDLKPLLQVYVLMPPHSQYEKVKYKESNVRTYFVFFSLNYSKGCVLTNSGVKWSQTALHGTTINGFYWVIGTESLKMQSKAGWVLPNVHAPIQVQYHLVMPKTEVTLSVIIMYFRLLFFLLNCNKKELWPQQCSKSQIPVLNPEWNHGKVDQNKNQNNIWCFCLP